MHRAPIVLTATLATFLLAGCGRALDGSVSAGTSATSAAREVVTVTVADDTCKVDPTTVEPGTVAFVVTNQASSGSALDVLVYTNGQQTVGEAPDIPAGATRTLLVRDMVPATYITVCRPGADGPETRGNLYVERPSDGSGS